MTIESIPRRPGLRSLATLLCVFLTALAIATSPLAAGTARASENRCDWGSRTGCKNLLAKSGGYLQRADAGSSANGTELAISRGLDSDLQWDIRPADNGTFHMFHHSANKCTDVDTSNYHVVLWDCDSQNEKQSWYAQPTGDERYYMIRNVKFPKKCLDVRGRSSDDKTPVILYDCNNGDNQKWSGLEDRDSGYGNPTNGQKFEDLVTNYALTQFNSGSDLIKATYKIVDKTSIAATNEPWQIVSVSSDKDGSSPFCFNASKSSKMTCSFNWQYSEATTTSVSNTLGVTTKVGTGKESPIQVEVSLQYQTTWGESHTTTATEGQTVAYEIPNLQKGWVATSRATKTTVGLHEFTNEFGTKWTGKGAAIAPVSGVDGKADILIYCTEDSPVPGCQESLKNYGAKQ
ncbi:RICIN domain-containing protein [Streptomyces sp. NPDC048637]|uniref:RICIN domain-containing protein n=1 Tax=Streptomyces sp. NPDC048637 TaxID=3155636 RepID=UPI003440B5B4